MVETLKVVHYREIKYCFETWVAVVTCKLSFHGDGVQ